MLCKAPEKLIFIVRTLYVLPSGKTLLKLSSVCLYCPVCAIVNKCDIILPFKELVNCDKLSFYVRKNI